MRMFPKLLGVMVCAFAVTIGSQMAMGKSINWDMANEYPADSIQGQNDAYFAKMLEEKSDGEISITHHYGGALGYKSVDQYDAVSDGVVALANTFTGGLRGMHPIFVLSSLPFRAKNMEEAYTRYQVAKSKYQDVLAESDQLLLFSCPWPPSGLWAKKAVKSKTDIENLKIRTYDPSGTITFKNIGASPIQLSWSDVIPQLTTGGIEAVLTSAESGVNGKFWELLSHFNELNYTIPLSLVHMNKYVFDSLPGELQQAVQEAAASAEKHAWDAAKNRVQENYKILVDHNVNIVDQIPQSFLDSLKEASQPAMNDWLEKMGATGEQIITDYKSRIKQ